MNEINPDTGITQEDLRALCNPNNYFEKGDGFQADRAAEAVCMFGPIGRGVDDRLWVWKAGVWRPGDKEVRERIVDILGRKYNPSLQRTIEGYLKGKRELPVIASLPIPDWINVKNGLFNWHEMRLYQHSEAYLSTVQLPVNWRDDAQCPLFMEFLRSVIAPDCLDFMQELTGYMLYSGNPFEKAFLLYGGGRNGKGVYMNVLNELIGADNVSQVNLQNLGDRFAKADLFGRVANLAGDIDSSTVERTGDFKAIVGNDKIRAEHKGKDAFAFYPFVTNVFSCNIIPQSVDTTVGYLDRWIVIKFPYYFGDKPDPTLKTRLCATSELEGVLVWAVQGLRRLMARGSFELPVSVEAANDEFALAIDPLRLFIKECARRTNDGSGVAQRDVYPVYVAWAQAQNRKTLSKTRFNERIQSLPGVSKVSVHGVDTFKGFVLTKSQADFGLSTWWVDNS